MSRTLAQVGEFGLIDKIHEVIEKEGAAPPQNLLGIGDDCAAFKPRPGYDLLVTCDCMVEDRHYLSRFMSPRDVGRRAMAINISDVGAMGGRPRYALISLGLRSDMPVNHVIAVYRGFLAELNPFDALIIGGNITKSSDANFIDVTLIGEVETGRMVRRSTAKPGDVILVTGYPGQAAAGLALLLERETSTNAVQNPLAEAYLHPFHRAPEGYAAAQTGLVRAMIDISDGFLGDLRHICEESGVGAVVHEQKFPVSPDLLRFAENAGGSPFDYIFRESDDYELLITCAPENGARIRSVIEEMGRVPVTEIGNITAERGVIQAKTPEGRTRTLSGSGWDHFSDKTD